ncbi:MAG: PAS domain S-box protein, partial [Armatimonadetes bacterium]|nr:PAS domain S-box protein [Armatimonadota bacterium]
TALDCIISMDHEGKVTEWNPAAETTFGYERAEAIGRQLGELIVPEALRERHYEGIAHYLTTGTGPVLDTRIEVPALRADGTEILVELSITTIPTDGPPLFTAYLRDITKRRLTEDALKAATAEAERANLAKSEFLSRMSHELRTPLNAILGFGQLLEMDDLNTEQERGVEQILKGGRHLLDLINEVLDIARIEAEAPQMEMESVAAVEVLSGALNMVRPLANGRSIELRGEWSAAQGLFVLADKRRFNQVLLNLLSNAVKYNRAGGTATLAAAPTGDGLLRITVSDTGAGIAPEKIERLWTPFDRLGAERTDIEGTGLGLALTRRLVEAMGGFVRVQSTLGEGSTFSVELPLISPSSQTDSAESGEQESRRPSQSPQTHALVLYIEDNLSNFNLVQNILRHRPEIKLLAATQGRTGVELAVKHRPDLILLDVNLPDIDGEEVMRLLRVDEGTRAIPVVAVSADATPQQIERIQAAGATQYLTKPLDVKRFLTMLDDSLPKSVPPSGREDS